MRARLVLGALGVAVTAYGAWLLWSRRDLADLFSAVRWVAGGVLVHDLLWAPLVVLVALALGRLLPSVLHAAAAAGLLVLGTLTVMAVPVLGAWGREQDPFNETLLDRDYTAGYLALVATVIIVVVVPVLLATVRRRRAGPDAPRGG